LHLLHQTLAQIGCRNTVHGQKFDTLVIKLLTDGTQNSCGALLVEAKIVVFNVKDFCPKVLPAQLHLVDDATDRAGAELTACSEKDRAKRAVIRTTPTGDQHGHAFAAQRVAHRIDQVTRWERQCVDILDEIAMLWHD
jgi:hypothetical protein